jgi:hypothetical protein
MKGIVNSVKQGGTTTADHPIEATCLRPDRQPADRFVGNRDAALQQHFLDQAQAQGKSKTEPHSHTARAMICGGKRWRL